MADREGRVICVFVTCVCKLYKVCGGDHGDVPEIPGCCTYIVSFAL
jgi:hypothetical protein